MLTGQTSCCIRHQHLLAISLDSVAPSPHLQLSHTTDSLKTADLNRQSLNCNWMQRSISNITRISEYSGSTQGISCDIDFPKNQPDITWGQNPRRKHHNSTETFLVNSPDMSWNSPISHSLQLQTPPTSCYQPPSRLLASIPARLFAARVRLSEPSPDRQQQPDRLRHTPRQQMLVCGETQRGEAFEKASNIYNNLKCTLCRTGFP